MPKVLIPLAPGFEDLEAIGSSDIFQRAGYEVVTAGLQPGTVAASRGTLVIPVTDLDTIIKEEFDIVALPGGQPGTNNLLADDRLGDLLKRHAAAGKITAAICAAPTVLAQAGLLAGKKATSYPGALEAMNLTDVTLTGEGTTVDDRVVTSRGAGTTIDFALAIVELMSGKEKRGEVEKALQR